MLSNFGNRKDRTKYKTVLEKDKVFVEQFLNRFYRSFENLFTDKSYASYVFIERLKKFDAIRFDETDKDLFPLKFAFDDMEESCEGKLEGGLLMPIMKHGVILLDMDFKNLSKAEGIHTLIHEMVHAMSLVEVFEDEKKVYKCGVNRSGRTFNRLNEGITEYISQLVWSDMYKNKTCPGIGRYDLEVKAAEMVMSLFESKEYFVEEYLINGTELQREMKVMKNNEGQTLFDFIKSFDKKGMRHKATQKIFTDKIKDFKNNCEIVK